MGFFGKNQANRNGLFNKIANPNADPNSGGLLGKIGGFNNGKGLLGGLFNRNKTTPPPTNQTTSFQDDNNKGGSSW